jgi:nucleoside-diphosphate-sugar epimerase
LNINGPVNIASGIPASIKDVINSMVRITNSSELEIHFDKTMPSMIPLRLISVKKIKNEISWTSKTSLHDGLKKTLEWYLDFYKTKNPEDNNDH